MRKYLSSIAFITLHLSFIACNKPSEQSVSTKIVQQKALQIADEYTLVGEKSFLSGYNPINEDSTINIVVEIPTGTTAKWEVSKPEGVMKWEIRNGKPRGVKYLGYPGNYGMIPQTLLPKELGGDGDPLDVILLGDALPRGTVTKGHLIGVLRLLDGGEQDDKLIVIPANSPLAEAQSLEELQEMFPGVTEIVETWFLNYKGKGVMESNGFGGRNEAEKILRSAIAAFSGN